MMQPHIKYHLASFLWHVVLLIMSLVVFQPMMLSKPLGEEHAEVIHAYVQLTQTKLPTSVEPQQKTLTSKPIIQSKPAISKQASQQRKVPSARQPSRGEKADELIALLHAAIQQAQHYPQNALALRREGRVLVSFKLLINGEVESVTVLQSSGVSSLDRAAISAVEQAAPFHDVKRYLPAPKTFAIHVVFALS